MMLSIVLTAYSGDVRDVRKVLQCLHQQTYKDYEVIPVLKLDEDEANRLHLSDWFDGIANTVYIMPPLGDSTGGNAQRRMGLKHATGEYICWVSADNLLYPDFVEQHSKCNSDVSIVNIDYWKDTRWGVLPRKLAVSNVDLLNFAMRRSLALTIDAFNAGDCKIWECDWVVLDRALRSGSHHWDETATTCAAHF